MENKTDIKISIPKPCNEDWNQMTPNEKGAFCDKCAKTVVDFTKKTTIEIKDFLIEQTGKKICGRFMSDQLDEKPKRFFNLSISKFSLPKNISLNKAFAIALFIVFGTGLFSCTTQSDHLVGDIALVDTAQSVTLKTVVDTPTVEGNINAVKNLLGDTTYAIPPQPLNGGLKVCTPLQGDVDIQTKGEVMIVPKDTIPNEEKVGKIKID